MTGAATHGPPGATCATCGADIDERDWHPVTTEVDGGRLRIYDFCREACRRRWLDARDRDGDGP